MQRFSSKFSLRYIPSSIRKKFATESIRPPEIPPPPPSKNLDMARIAVILFGVSIGAYIVFQPRNDYDKIQPMIPKPSTE